MTSAKLIERIVANRALFEQRQVRCGAVVFAELSWKLEWLFEQRQVGWEVAMFQWRHGLEVFHTAGRAAESVPCLSSATCDAGLVIRGCCCIVVVGAGAAV